MVTHVKVAIRLATVMLLLAFTNGAFAQRTISGTVKDAANGSTIPGVNVSVKGAKGVGTATSIDGAFSIKLPNGPQTLVISFIGYTTQEVAVNYQTKIDVLLQPATQKIDEVVVTALGIKRQTKALGYSVTEVKGAEIAQANVVNPVSALQGKVAGVTIGGSDGGMFGGAKIQIRGVSTLGGKNRPIFVVDGIILDNNTSGDSEWSSSANDWGNELKNLNPDDFESVSVLKGSASTALYGSRGLYGAVVITTKNAKSAKGLGVSISQTTGVDLVYKTPDLQNEYGPGTLAGYVYYGNQNPNDPINQFDANQFFYREVNGEYVRSLADLNGEMSWGARFDGKPIFGYDHQMTTYQAYKNNMKDAYELGWNSNTNVTVTGGNDKTKFLLSDSYNYRKGNYVGNTFEKNSFLVKASHKLNDKIEVEGSLSLTTSTPKNPANGDQGNMFAESIPRAYDTKKFKEMYTAVHGGVPDNKYNDELGDVPGTGYWFGLNNTKSERNELTVTPIVKITADATDWLKILLEGNMNIYSYNGSTRQLGSGYMNEGGYFGVSQYKKTQKTGKINFNIHKNVNDFNFSLIAGAESYNTFSSYASAGTDGGLIVPGNYSLANSKKMVIGSGADRVGEKTISSLYYLFNTSWKDQLYLDITGRNDWSSALVYANGKGTNSYFYPSISTSWLASQTFDLPSWVSFAKLRFSWAQVGNDTDPYAINSGYAQDKLQQGNDEYIYRNVLPGDIISPDLKPERKTSFELGSDIRLFNNRLGVDLTLYKENTYNQIIRIPVPLESGASSMFVNAGNIENKGIELGVKTVPVKTNDFEWDFDINYSKNFNKIISLHESVGQYKSLAGDPAYGNYRVGSVAWIGGEYGELLSDILPQKYQAVDANGNAIEDALNGMNVLSWNNTRRGALVNRSNKVQKIGSTLPKFEASINNTLTYKGISLNFMIDMRFGGYLTSYNNRYGTAYGFLETSLRYRDEAHGGTTWTSKYDGVTYHDGVIPDGVFPKGTNFATPAGTSVTTDKAMTYKDAVAAGYIEPTHASYWHYRQNSWGQGVVNDDWVSEIKYVALRQVSLGYNIPNSVTKRLGITGMRVSFDGRNLMYLYNSLPNHLNPESTRGNSSAYSYFERSFSPYIATYAVTVKFNM